MQLEGKSIVVMGAGSGVGRASALRFAEEGAKVVVADVDLERAKETVRLIEAAGGTARRRSVRRVEGGRRRGHDRAAVDRASAGSTSSSTTSASRRRGSG